MNKKIKNSFYILIVIVAVFFLKSLFASEEKIIKERLLELNSLVQFSEKLQLIESGARSKKALNFLSEQVKINWMVEKERKVVNFSSEEVRKNLLAVFNYLEKLETNIKVKDIKIDKKKATLEIKGSALGSSPSYSTESDGRFLEMHVVKIALVKQGGDWLVKEVWHIDNLRE